MKYYNEKTVKKEKLPFPTVTVLVVLITSSVIVFLWLKGMESKRTKNLEAPIQRVQTNASEQITNNSVSASPLVVKDKGARFSIVSQSKDSQAPVAQENPHLKN